jgi:hypothetical protein
VLARFHTQKPGAGSAASLAKTNYNIQVFDAKVLGISDVADANAASFTKKAVFIAVIVYPDVKELPLD